MMFAKNWYRNYYNIEYYDFIPTLYITKCESSIIIHA